MIYTLYNNESDCSKRNLKFKNLSNCMKFWGIVLENSVTCFATRDRANLLKRLKVHSYIFIIFAMNLGLFLFLCSKTFCWLFLLQITTKSRENPEILYKRTFVSTAPSKYKVFREDCEHQECRWFSNSFACSKISTAFSYLRRLTDPYINPS